MALTTLKCPQFQKKFEILSVCLSRFSVHEGEGGHCGRAEGKGILGEWGVG
jgi:hypothetical protein